LSAFLISILTLSPTFIAMSSYSFIVILKVGESLSIPPPAPLPKILDMTFGRFFIKSSGEVNGTASPLPPPPVDLRNGSGSEGEGAGSAESETNSGSSEASETGEMADTGGGDFGGFDGGGFGDF
jgi:hypothetical protein